MYIYFIIFVLLCYSLVATYFAMKFALLILKIEDIINESLEDLDRSFSVFNEILKKPVFFDSVEVRQCISEISSVRSLLINIAKRLTEVDNNNFQQGKIVDNERKEENEVTERA